MKNGYNSNEQHRRSNKSYTKDKLSPKKYSSNSDVTDEQLLLHQVSSHVKNNASQGLIMLVDGIGLAVINAATILEGIILWNDFFNEFWITNSSSLSFWIAGRSCQVIGLFFLIAHAASFQIMQEVEKLGMWLLTVGPILNMIASFLFDSNVDPYYFYNRQWVLNEILEIVGILWIDCSYIHMAEIYEMTVEQIGFFFLFLAATLDFEFTIDSHFPTVEMRFDLVHLGEGFGLILLSIVSYCQYRKKIADEKLHHQNNHSNSIESKKHFHV